MEPIRIFVLAAASMLVMMMVIISSASLELTEEEEPVPSIISTITTAAASQFLSEMQFRIGNTPVSGVPDTGSDLIWTIHSHLFDALPKDCPSDDGSGSKPSSCCNGFCIFEKQYGGTVKPVKVKGVIGQAKLTFGESNSYTNRDLINVGSALIVRCLSSSSSSSSLDDDDAAAGGGAENKLQACKPRSGIVGLGRGELSLVSQLGLHSFSYCLPQYNPADASQTTTGYIKFNDAAAVSFEGTTTTKLVNPQGLTYPASSRYYVGLEKIQVGSKSVGVPNGCLKDPSSSGYGGMVIDSGTAVTHLPEKAFNAVKKHAEELIKDIKPSDNPNCYKGTYPNEMDDSIVLHFCSDGQKEIPGQMKIPAKSYFYKIGDNEFCLAFNEQKDPPNMSILGAYQQQDMHMQFNIKDNTLSFAKRSACGKSQEENHATM